jgi:Protein of unknown function (DUF1592)/Protein of unknown function (DUF1588)/Protein of unknown function (DUF1587)/Protein of unknown function (DUF1585)/Protein of unknown function (DUF1595)/Planctomycete cytochrome C
MRRSLTLLFPGLLLVPMLYGQSGDVPTKPSFQSTTTAKSPSEQLNYRVDIAPLFKKYCTSCHGGAKPKADLLLEFADEKDVQEKVAKDRGLWERVVAHIRSGEMPPASRPQPTEEERARLVTWINRDVLVVDCTGPRNPGRVTIRRLNNYEYNNTIRDLLYLKNFNVTEDFPADDRAYGFDNNGDILTLSPNLVELYLQAAERASAAAFKTPQSKNMLIRGEKNAKFEFSDWQAKVRLRIEDFLPRAWRRPVTKEEVDRLMQFAALGFAHETENSDRATSVAFRAAMMSPEFLFRIERDPDPDGKGVIVPLNEFELASRLSYFLWSSMPDDELFKLAREQKLRSQLEPQVRRMLKDSKAVALTESFANQWLEIRNLEKVERDPKFYPNFTPELRKSMKKETELFFEAILKENRSIIDLLDSDFTFVNEVLARHYGIPDIQGEKFQRVQLDPAKRGGLLTHASILTVTSRPTRTSAVNRGKWILDNLFNSPPPAPPPDVPPLVEEGKPLTGTLRQKLEQHRQDPNCITCHQRMDPLGLALENFDATGAWRNQDGAEAVDPSGQLATGEKFKTPQDFRSMLLSKKALFRRGLAEKMLIYAIGRGLEHYDTCAIDDICANLARADDRFSALIHEIVKCDPFQYRKGKGSIKS